MRPPRSLLALAVLLAAPAFLPATASAATCTYDPDAGRVAVGYSGAGTVARLDRTAAGAIRLDGAACGAATVTNTDQIDATGGYGLQRLEIDLRGGPLAPGRTPETGSTPEIEISVDAVVGGEFPLADEVRVIGTPGDDLIRFAGSEVFLNADADSDVATASVEGLGAQGGGGADRLLGGEGYVPLTLDGGEGNDELAGGDGDDTLTGGPGDDTESGNGGTDHMRQGPAPDGRDVLDGGGSPYDRIDYSQRATAVRIDPDGVADDGAAGELDDIRDTFEYFAGGAGGDTIVASQARYQPFDLAGNGGDDTITGGTNYDRLDGGPGADVLTGLGGSDSFYAGPGDDRMSGGEMGDVFHEDETRGPSGADDMRGGTGVDRYSAPGRDDGLTVTLADNLPNDGGKDEGDNVRSDIESVTTGRGDDTILGTSAANVFEGGAGNDTLGGGSGNDELYGRGGDDRLGGGSGRDLVFGYEGADAMDGGTGADLLDGGSEDDHVGYATRTAAVTVTLDGTPNDGEAGEGDDVRAERVTGGAGADRLTGSGAADILEGGDGADTLHGADGTDKLLGGAGGDDLAGGEAKDELLGGDGDDSMSGDDGDDRLEGNAGADVMRGDGGKDFVDYRGVTGAVTVTVGRGADDGAPGEGDDVRTEDVAGGPGADKLTGDDENNFLDGGTGDDLLDGGGGADLLAGAGGTDTVTYAGRTGRVAVSLDGVPRDGTETTGDALAEESDNVTATTEKVIGGGGNDALVGSPGANTLSGGAGDDRLDGGMGPDVLDGEGGRDVADYGWRGAPLVISVDGVANDGERIGEGDQVMTTIEVVQSGKGDDRLTGGPGAEELNGGPGADVLSGGRAPAGGTDGADRLVGGAGEDTATYADRGAGDAVFATLDGIANDGRREGGENDDVEADVENLTGGAGDDDLRGTSYANVLDGGPGRDALYARGGDDRLDAGPDPANLVGDGDDLFGGEGRDVADYSRRTDAVTVTIDQIPNDGRPAAEGRVAEGDNVHTDVETVVGGAGGDSLTGDDFPNRLEGGGGDDRVWGRGGDDDMHGGEGKDTLSGGDQNDALHGGPGNNGLAGGNGDDRFVETATRTGNDKYSGGAGQDTVDYSARTVRVVIDNDGFGVFGDDGEDANGDHDADEADRIGSDIEVLRGGRGGDRMAQARTGTGCFVLDGGPGGDHLYGGDGTDRLLGGPDGDGVYGYDGDDDLVGGPGNDIEHGGEGSDFFFQGGLADPCNFRSGVHIDGGDGADHIDGGDGTDTVDYLRHASTPLEIRLDGLAHDGAEGEGDNVEVEKVWGGEADDIIVGDDGRNLLAGGGGNDELAGGDGDDVLTVINGADTAYGQDGDDTFEAEDGDNADKLDGGADDDTGKWDPGDTRTNIP